MIPEPRAPIQGTVVLRDRYRARPNVIGVLVCALNDMCEAIGNRDIHWVKK